MKEIKVLCASGSLGLTPLHPESYWAGVDRLPDVVAADAGSGDIGPYYLGSGARYNPREWEKFDLAHMLRAAHKLGIPMIVGSAGGAGINASVDSYAEIIEEIASEEGLSGFRMALIYSELDLQELSERAAKEVIPPLGAPLPLTQEDINCTNRAVAMMGVEPIIETLDAGAQVVIAGRACDDVLFAAVPIWKGFDHGISFHMGKTIECGPLVATPILQREAVMAIVREDHFLVEPLHPDQRCTPASVAGHTLYERTDAIRQATAGGIVDLSAVQFEAHNDRVVKVIGSRFEVTQPYTVKVEGSGYVGERALLIFGVRDPLSLKNLDSILDAIRIEVRHVYADRQEGEDYHLIFHVYGRDAVMRELEPTPVIDGHEVAVVTEVVAKTQDLAVNIAKLAKYNAFRAHYEGKLGTAGGVAMIADEVLVPDHVAYRWTIDHLLPLEVPTKPFSVNFVNI